MTSYRRIYETEWVSVMLITSIYQTAYTVTDYNPTASVSLPIEGGFIYRAGNFGGMADCNVVLLERSDVEFDVKKITGFNRDRTISIQFRDDDTEWVQSLLSCGQVARTIRRTPRIEVLLRRFLSVPTKGNKLRKDQILEELLVENIINHTLPSVGKIQVSPWHSRKIDLAKDYIHSYSSNDLSVADISGACHISSFHFSRLFKKLTGYSPYEYLILVRIQHARECLRDGCSVTSTAFETGFNSLSNFSYRFKQAVGMSPIQYQQSKISKAH